MWCRCWWLFGHRVALRKESVDRNPGFAKFAYGRINVALRKESVDRNHDDMLRYRDAEVALRKESVDRNTRGQFIGQQGQSRSPQGERG